MDTATKVTMIFIACFILVLVLVFGLLAYKSAPKTTDLPLPQESASTTPAVTIATSSIPVATTTAPVSQSRTIVPGLTATDAVLGTGLEAKAGDTVQVQYTGTLSSGKKFDSSYDHGGAPFSFTLGKGEVIKGWDLGVLGMKTGGKRKLVIAPDLAYGKQDIGNDLIPPNSTLIFDVELVSVGGKK